jgi:hypothetical protein
VRFAAVAVQPVSLEEIAPLLDAAREAATAYYRLTGKPLGITGEIGEYEAAKLLGLTLVSARTPGFDAIGSDGRRIQIKARMFDPARPLGGQRMGSIKQGSEFDTVMLVMLDTSYMPWAIWEAEREPVLTALAAPGSKSRNERGALAVTKFKSIAVEVWPRQAHSVAA